MYALISVLCLPFLLFGGDGGYHFLYFTRLRQE